MSGATQFFFDLYILLVSEAEVVLGIQWLKILGPTFTDYANLTLHFVWMGTPIHLQGICENHITEVSSSQLKRLLDTKSNSAFYHLEMTSYITYNSPDFFDVPPMIAPLLQQFIHIFQEPQGLPPVRNISHQIQLIPQATPVNVRP